MSKQSAAVPTSQRCPATRRDGSQCSAKATVEGWCIGHAPGAEEARRRGGAATSRSNRAQKLLPVRLRPIVLLLERAIFDVYQGTLDPRRGSALASLAGALVKVLSTGEIEERLRVLEKQVGERYDPT